MDILNFIDIPTFILSLGIGFFFVYISLPSIDVIYVYPNPDNIDKLLYKDKSGICQRFSARKVKCPNNTSLIRKYPIHIKKNTS